MTIFPRLLFQEKAKQEKQKTPEEEDTKLTYNFSGRKQ